MAEVEGEPIKITLDDVEEANQLSLACPMCAGPVYRAFDEAAMAPVECASCETAYHKACWDSVGAKCAMVGCDCTRVRAYDSPAPGGVVINQTDFRQRGPVITEDLKRQQQEMRRQLESGSLLGRFLRWLIRQIRIG